jgi:single-stranded-DNA-specific exonuclease
LEALRTKVLQRSLEAGEPKEVEVEDLVSLASLGTMADVVDLTGPNRWIVQRGLERINMIPGLKALLELRGLRNPSARDVTFLIIPMLNAPGRLDSPEPSVELLLCDDPLRAQILANDLQIANTTRQTIGASMLSLAKKQVDDPRKFPDTLSSIFFWTKDRFRHGLVGILAGQLAETYGRPSFVAAGESGSPMIKGSARSGVFDIHGEVVSVKEIMDRAEEVYQERHKGAFPEYESLFVTYGGHPAAGGFTAPLELATVVRDCIDRATAPLMKDVPMGRVVRADVTWKLPTAEELESLKTLEPTGHGFEAPLIYIPNVEIGDIRYTPIPNQSFKARTIILRQGDRKMEAVCFKKGQRFEIGQRFDLLCAPHREGMQIQELREILIDLPEPTIAAEEYDLDGILMG